MTTVPHQTCYLDLPTGQKLAFQQQPGMSPGLLFLPGFRSDMGGIKAEALAQWCAREGRAFTRFDYRGHGASDGEFKQLTLAHWLQDTLAMLDALSPVRQILVGSSMGGWLALLAAARRPAQVAGLVGIAPAPDFTGRLYRDVLDSSQRRALAERGHCEIDSDYDDGPYIITRGLIDSGSTLSVMDRPLPLPFPVRIIHGQSDASVPWQSSVALLENLQSADAELLLVKQGDHRLSTAADINRIQALLAGLLRQADLNGRDS